MTRQQDDEHRKIGEAVNGFGMLAPRQVTIYEWRVLSWRNDTITAHKVNIEELRCTCSDAEYRRENPEVCDHVAVALYEASRQLDVGDALSDQMYTQMQDLERHVRAIERRASGIEAEAAAAGAATDSEGAASQSDGFDGDPVEYMESYLRDAGLDPGDFEIWVDDEYGSLQVEQEGYLSDDEFSTWVDLKDDLGMGYDGENDRNYLQADDFGEVFG